MTTPSGFPKSSLAYWGAALGAVANRASTADVWAAIRDQATSLGRATPGLTLSDFNQLRSAAAAQRNASEAFARGNPASGLSDNMISTAPFARSLAQMNAEPTYLVGFNHTTVDDDGNETTAYRMIRFTGPLPATVGDLHTAISNDAEALADKYDEQHVGYTDARIMRV